MKNYRLLILVICLYLTGCTSLGTSKKSHKFKIKKEDFTGQSIATPDTSIKTKVKLEFEFEENEPGDKDHPLYIIPPEKGGVHWVLVGNGKKYGPKDELKIYKLNPDHKTGKEKGHLKKATPNEKFYKTLKLDELLKGQNVPAGLYTLEATYSWYKKDPELNKEGYCPETPVASDCFTIFIGEISAEALTIILPQIP